MKSEGSCALCQALPAPCQPPWGQIPWSTALPGARAANSCTAQLRAGILLPWGAHVSGLCLRGCPTPAVTVPTSLTNP